VRRPAIARALRAVLALAAAGALSDPVARPALGAEVRVLEYAVKANFLYKFADYVSWPAQALGADNAPVNLCVAGDDPFGRVLDDAVAGERLGTHPLAVRRMDEVTPDAPCHILFTRGSARQDIADALKAVEGRPVLTITEASNHGPGGGVITFVLKDNRVRFEIDQQAAAANGLEVSSKLLELAITVRPRSGGQAQ
jgi:hypothetical protein